MAGQIPLVVIGWHVDHPEVDVVRTSDEHGLALAVRHLVDLGHRRIAHLQGGTGLLAVARRDAYVQAMREHQLEAQTDVVLCAGEDQLDGQRAARALIESGHRLPSALIAFNDDVAAAAMSVLTQHGIDIPRDLSIVGFDDSALARSPEVDLTSVQQVPQEMARQAIERILARSGDRQVPSREIVLEPELRIRSSTGPAPSP